jgi:hypothetical protein
MKTQHLCGTTLLLLALVCGCIDDKKRTAPVPPTPQSASVVPHDNIISAVQMEAPPGSPRDAQPTVPMVFQLACYQITVPVGTVSKNEDFWKRIDETAMDPARHDLLLHNGMRLGTAPLSEFENIRSFLEDTQTHSKVMGTVGAEAQNMELPMRSNIPFETICYYGQGNEMTGRTFDASENIFNISYRRTPRKLGDMRLTLAPRVRSIKKHLEYTAKNDEIEIQYVAPQKFYLNIEADLPMDQFLVLGPADTSDLPTCIGHQFFLKDEPAQQMEQVLIFAAQPFRIDEIKEARKDPSK